MSITTDPLPTPSESVDSSSDTIPLCVPQFHGDEWEYVKDCLDSGWVGPLGPYLDRLEREVAAIVGADHAVATASGTAALHTALILAGVGPGDEVLVPSMTFIAPLNAIRYVGAWPVFMDANPGDWQLDVNKVGDFVTNHCEWRCGELWNRQTSRRVKALLPVHILGHACDLDSIEEISRQYHLSLVEDAAEGLGVTYNGESVGARGDVGCLSFNSNKIVTAGGGGMIVTNDEKLAERARFLTTQAKNGSVEFIHAEVGYNYRLSNTQAALACSQLRHLQEHIDKKRRIASSYKASLTEERGFSSIAEQKGVEATFWMYTVLVDRDTYGLSSRQLLEKLRAARIETRPLWQPGHMSPAHEGCQAFHCDVAEHLFERALSLPCSVALENADQERVIETITQL